MKKIIDLISSLNIGIEQKVALALIALGERPSVELTLYKWNTAVEKVVDILKETGLIAIPIPRSQASNNKNLIACFAVSASAGIAQQLRNVIMDRDKIEPVVFDCVYGSLMGYPATAINGYITGKKLPKENYPVEIDERSIRCFVLSASGWKEEVKVIERWTRLLSLHAPDILDEYVNNVTAA